MADLNKYVQTNTFYLAGSGVVIGATSAALTSLTDIYGNVLTMTDFGTTGYITFEPDTTNEEAATFTGITANTNGTYTLTGLKTCLAKDPYTQTSALVRQHSGGTKVVVTDNVAFWATFANKANDETITGTWLVPTGGTGTQVANATDIANAISGASGTATNLVFGTVKLSVAAAAPLVPIVVGDNDPRMLPTTGTSGGILGFTSTTVRASSVLLTNHALIVGGGAGATPTPLASLGTTTTLLHGNASGDPTFGAVVLTTDVSGILPVANGGTGVATSILPKIAVLSTTLSVNNTSAETALITASIPANTLGTSNAVRVRIVFKSINGGSDTLTFKFKYGSTTVITGTTWTPINGTVCIGTLEFILYGNGGTSIQFGSVYQNFDRTDATYIGTANAKQSLSGTAAEDSTGALNLVVTSTWSSTNGVLTVAGITVEKIS